MAAVCMSQYDTQLSAVRVRTVGTINYACMESAPTSPVSWRGLWWRAQALLVYRNAAIQLPNRPYLSRPPPPPVGGLNRVYLEAGTRVLKLLDMLSRRYAVVTSRTRWMTFPGNEPSAYAYEHVHRSCQLSEYSHQTFRLRYNQMRWVESR